MLAYMGFGKRAKPEGEGDTRSKARNMKNRLETGPRVGQGMSKGNH